MSMDFTQGAQNSTEMHIESNPKRTTDESINVKIEEIEHPVLDEKTATKSRRIHPRCDRDGGGISCFFDEETCDVNFVFDVDGIEEVVPAHKCILAFNSPVFRQMFYGELKEKGDIKLTDTTVDAFIDFLECIYHLFVTDGFSESKMSRLLHLAHKYDVNWLEEACKQFLDESIDQNITSVLWVLPLATLYSYDELRQKCIKTIELNGNAVIESDEFVDCDAEVVKEIFSINFRHRNEVSLFEMYIKWAKKAREESGFELNSESPKNIRKQLGNCFDLIRFESMNMVEFMQCLSINSGVFTPNEIQQYARKVIGTTPYQEQQIKKCIVKQRKKKYIVWIVSPFFDPCTSSLQLLFEDKEMADVTFVIKNNNNEEVDRILAHKCIVMFHSQVFQKTINQNEEIDIIGASPVVFNICLRLIYVYSGEQFFSIVKNIADQYLEPILSIAERYEMFWIIIWYSLYLSETMNEQNVIRRFELAHKHSLNELKMECIDLMKEKGEKIITSDAFLDCSQENLKAILELRIWDDKKSLAGTCIKWAQKYCRENQLDAAISYDLRTALGDAFEHIPFSALDPMEFLDFQGDYGDLFTGDEIKKIAKQVTDRRNMKKT